MANTKDQKSSADKLVSGTYHGNFSSSNYVMGIAKGNIQALADFKNNSARFRLTYTGLYNNGKIRAFNADIDRTAQEMTFTTKPVIIDGKPHGQKLIFKVTSIEITEAEQRINGTYVSQEPSDTGNWTLIKADFDYDKPPAADQGGCTIM